MSVDYEDEILKSDSDNIESDYIEYARITFGNENSYFMKSDKIIIGRNSADGTVDVDVGPHTFVSRKHLEVMYSYKKLKVKCLGKNGIFIDNYFKAHSAIPYELPYECTLRFPSTNIEVNVHQLLGRKRLDYQQQQQQRHCHNDSTELNRPLNRKRKAPKSTDKLQYNAFDIGANEPRLNECDRPPLRQSLAEPIIKRESSVNNNNNNCESINAESAVDQVANHFLSNGKSSATTFPLSSESVADNSTKLANVCIEKSCSIPQIVLNPRSYRSYSYNGDVIYTHNSQVFSSIYDSKDLAIEYGTDTQKPPYSYAQLIVQAVSSSRDRQLTLNGIYNYISKHYPYFKSHDKGWQNSVRHNLSLNRYFIKVPRGQDEPGKGSFWRVDGAYESKLIAQAFRKRRLRSNNGGSICSDNIPSASRVFSLTGGRAGNICAMSDHRNAKLNHNIFTLRRSDQKTPTTTFVFRKMSDTTHQFAESVFGSANVLHKQQQQSDLSHRINTISPENVFHTTASSTSAATTTITSNSNTNKSIMSRPAQKRVFQSPISMIRKTSSNSTTSTLISIGGKVFSTNKLKPIQLLSTKNPTSFVSVKQHHSESSTCNTSTTSSSSKYILIASSQIEAAATASHHKSLSLSSSSSSSSSSQNGQLISITGSGTLHSLLPHSTDTDVTPEDSTVTILSTGGGHQQYHHQHQNQRDSSSSSRCCGKSRQPASSPLSVSETCEFTLDEPSQLDSSSTELGPLSPSLRFSQSLQHEDDDDDDLDLEMDQFLDSYSILDQPPHDIDSNPDLYKEDVDDYCVWQDESFGLQDVEIEIH